jgi:hypothetical protein
MRRAASGGWVVDALAVLWTSTGGGAQKSFPSGSNVAGADWSVYAASGNGDALHSLGRWVVVIYAGGGKSDKVPSGGRVMAYAHGLAL